MPRRSRLPRLTEACRSLQRVFRVAALLLELKRGLTGWRDEVEDASMSRKQDKAESRLAAFRRITTSRMTSLLYISVLFSLLLVGCAHRHETKSLAPAVGEKVSTGADAIAVVLADIQRRGGDPKRVECSAKKVDGAWWVMAWHIWFPNNVGSSRFAPGGFTEYVVSTKGKILETLPGR